MLTLHGAMPKQTDFKQSLCVDIQGFSLHAAGCVRASQGRGSALDRPGNPGGNRCERHTSRARCHAAPCAPRSCPHARAGFIGAYFGSPAMNMIPGTVRAANGGISVGMTSIID